jgi:hypothetical protein
MKDRRTDSLHEKGIIIKVVLYEQHVTCALLACASHHHIKRPIFVQVDENCHPSVRDTRESVDAFAHLAPPAPGTCHRASRNTAPTRNGEEEMHATLCDQEQVGKPVQIRIARAW